MDNISNFFDNFYFHQHCNQHLNKFSCDNWFWVVWDLLGQSTSLGVHTGRYQIFLWKMLFADDLAGRCLWWHWNFGSDPQYHFPFFQVHLNICNRTTEMFQNWIFLQKRFLILPLFTFHCISIFCHSLLCSLISWALLFAERFCSNLETPGRR